VKKLNVNRVVRAAREGYSVAEAAKYAGVTEKQAKEIATHYKLKFGAEKKSAEAEG